MDKPVTERRPKTAPDTTPVQRPAGRHSWLGGAVFTAFLLGLIALSIRTVSSDLAFVLLGSVGIVVGVFHYVFPGSQFFTLALTNFIGVYACVFVFFLESNFHALDPMAQALGFVLPLLAFLGGAWWRARDIRSIVQARRIRDGGSLDRIFLWMAPVWGIGALTFLVPGREFPPEMLAELFVASMGAIAVIVAFVSRDIAVFLLDAGLLFEGFFQQASRLVLPAFAFLTFYSLAIIMFGAIYTIMDRFMVDPNFIIDGVRRDISLPEGLYFSLVTFATVGYGDIYPITGAVRFVCAIEIVLGVLLLLFGFSAIIGHTKMTDRRDHDPL
ncbi:MAG TPA: ion channel [Azospirillum sp.]